MKTKEEEEEERRKDVERMRTKLIKMDKEDERQEKQRQKRETKRKVLREQLRNIEGATDTEDHGDVVMHSPLSPHQLSTAKGKVVNYITSNISFIETGAHVVQLWDYNAEHGVAARGDRSRSAISAAVKAALVDKTIVDNMAIMHKAMKPNNSKNQGRLTNSQTLINEVLLSIASKSLSETEEITMMDVSRRLNGGINMGDTAQRTFNNKIDGRAERF